MKLYLILLSLFLLGTFTSSAQDSTGSIKGIIIDSLDTPLGNASVNLLHAEDSSSAYSTLADDKGAFFISKIKYGKYLFLISYIGYQRVTVPIEFSKEKSNLDWGQIKMKSASISLNGVTIIQTAPPLQIKGDTLEFNAGSFKTQPNAVVEELLKKIPGLQVEPDGTITSEGETITEILVDGKPFFGDDPKLATKNLPAEIIDKVQVFDKKSDQAEFTGIDDGNEKKTINLKVKKDRKKGVFGQAEAGAGTEDRYATRLNLFRFNNDQQISFVGSGNNTNQRGYSFRGGPSGGSGGNGNGNTDSWMGGVNYKDEINDKLEITGSYFYNYNKNKTQREQNTQYILPDTSYFKEDIQNRISETNNHRFNMKMDYKIDSLNSIIFTPNISYSKNSSLNTSTYTSNDINKNPINSGGTFYSSAAESPNINGSLLYRRKFNKPGRTISLNLNGGTNNNRSDGLNQQETNIFTGGVQEEDSINQQFFQRNDSHNWGTRLSYTEPLSEQVSLEVHLDHRTSKSTSERDAYNQDPMSHKYNVLDSVYSNGFINTFLTNEAGFNIQTRKEKYDYTFGFNAKKNDLDNYSITGDSTFTQNTFNYYPIARFNYNFSNTQRLRINYRGSTGQPSINQLQPVPDNTQSLRVRVGNPDLKPSFTHSIQANYRDFNRETNNMLFANISAGTTQNAIVNSTNYLDGGKQEIRYENAGGNYNLNGRLTAGFSIGQQNNMISTTSSFSKRKSSSFINSQRNASNNLNLSERLSLNFYYEELIDLRVSTNISYNRASYSLQESQNTRYFSYGGSLDLNVNLPAHLTIGTNFRYSGNSGLSQGFNQKIASWNASISKYVFNDQKGMIKLAAYDLLNQQVNITRSITAEHIQDVRTNVVPQYFILSFTYFLKNFSGQGGRAPMMPMPGGGGFRGGGGWRG